LALLLRDKNMKGFTTLVTTIIIGAIGVTAVTSVLLLGSAKTRTSIAIDQSQKAKQLANACAESALQLLHDNFSFVGSSGYSLGDGNCTYTVTAGAGENRTVTAQGTVGASPNTVTRKIQVDITQLTGSIVASWKEIQ
jgi:hypothetical protein